MGYHGLVNNLQNLVIGGKVTDGLGDMDPDLSVYLGGFSVEETCGFLFLNCGKWFVGVSGVVVGGDDPGGCIRVEGLFCSRLLSGGGLFVGVSGALVVIVVLVVVVAAVVVVLGVGVGGYFVGAGVGVGVATDGFMPFICSWRV